MILKTHNPLKYTESNNQKSSQCHGCLPRQANKKTQKRPRKFHSSSGSSSSSRPPWKLGMELPAPPSPRTLQDSSSAAPRTPPTCSERSSSACSSTDRFEFVAFDIETEGLHPREHDVTCVAFYTEGVAPITVLFCDCRHDPDETARRRDMVIRTLDAAGVILGFNAVRFDLWFLGTRWAIDTSRLASWVLKTRDPHHACYLLADRRVSLASAALVNEVSHTKSGTGAEAVLMARRGQFKRLAEYNAQDAVVTWELLMQRERKIVMPFHSGGAIVLDYGGEKLAHIHRM